jgi:hypothetical protein
MKASGQIIGGGGGRRKRQRGAFQTRAPDPFDFFGKLKWLDHRPLLDTIEPYRRRMLSEALYTFDPDGHPHYDRVVRGVAKKKPQDHGPLPQRTVPVSGLAVGRRQRLLRCGE